MATVAAAETEATMVAGAGGVRNGTDGSVDGSGRLNVKMSKCSNRVIDCRVDLMLILISCTASNLILCHRSHLKTFFYLPDFLVTILNQITRPDLSVAIAATVAIQDTQKNFVYYSERNCT